MRTGPNSPPGICSSRFSMDSAFGDSAFGDSAFGDSAFRGYCESLSPFPSISPSSPFHSHQFSWHGAFRPCFFKLDNSAESGHGVDNPGIGDSASDFSDASFNSVSEIPPERQTRSTPRSVSQNRSGSVSLHAATHFQGDEILNLPSGVQRYDEHTVHLLTNYLLANNSRQENAELAGRLVFPHNEEGAVLFAESTLKELSQTKQARLQASVFFPDNQYAAEAYAKFTNTNGRVQLTLDELAGLYAGREIKGEPDTARAYTEVLRAAWKPFHEGEVDREKLARSLTELVRKELSGDDYAASTNIELGKFFKQQAEVVADVLADPLLGLTTEERERRSAKIMRRSEMEKWALPRLVIQGLQSITSIESELKQAGYVEELSSVEDLSKLFHTSEDRIRDYLRVCQRGSHYLETEEHLAQLEKDRAYVIQSTRRAIELHQNGDLGSLKSDTEHAERLRLSPIGVFKTLRTALSEDDWNYRSFVLRQQGILDEHRQNVLSFVRDEIAALLDGNTHRLSTSTEIADIFRVSPAVINHALNNPVSGLETSQHEIRRFALSCQQPADKLVEVLHLITVMTVKETLERARAEQEEEERASEEFEPAEPKTHHKLIVNGAPYDSVEEAVAAACLTEFLAHFEIKPGITHQVGVANGRVDFLINNCIIEYHPIKAFWSKDRGGDFKTRDEYVRYIELRDSPGLSEARKRLFVDETKARLEQEYKQDRRALIDSDPRYQGTELIVATTKEELYHSVVKRFTDSPVTLTRFKKAWARNLRIINRIRLRQDRESSTEG